MRRRLLAFAAAVVLPVAGLLGAAPALAAPTPQLGPPPVEGDCLVIGGEGTRCYYAVGGVTFTMGKHVLRIGETTTASMSSGYVSQPGFNYWLPRLFTNTLNMGDFDTVGEACPALFEFGGSGSCTLKAKAATGGWRTHGYTYTQIGSNAYEDGDYYAIVGPDTYEIAGTVRGRERGSKVDKPISGATMVVEQIGGDGEKYTQATNANGRYSVLVKEGQWKVRSTKKGVCASLGTTGCQRSVTTTTPSDRTIDFKGPAPVKVTGTVTSGDDEPVEGIKIRAVAADEEPREATSAADGTYTLEPLTPGVAWVLDAPGRLDVCPKGPAGAELLPNGRCKEPTKTVTPESDIIVDFQKPGCVKKVDFGSSMQAKGECFESDGPEEWHTTKAFRMNGLDFPEGGNVVFDATSRRVRFEGDRTVKLPYKKQAYLVGGVPGGADVGFETETTKFSLFLAGTIPPMKTFVGWPVSGKLGVEMTAGTSAVSLEIALPTDPTKAFDWKEGSFGDGKGVVGVGLKITTDNDNGVRAIELGVNNSGELPDKAIFKNPIFKLSEAKMAYDLVDDQLTISGKGAPSFLNPPAPALDPNAINIEIGEKASKEISGTLVTTGVPFAGGHFVSLALGVDGLNFPVYGKAIYLQRASVTLPLGNLHHNGPGSFSAGLGFSLDQKHEPQKLGPLLILPSEFVSVDGQFGVAWDKIGDYGLENLAITGSVATKLWDQPAGTLKAGVWPARGIVGGKLDMGLSDPTGGTIFTIGGAGELWLDASTSRAYAAARGQISILGLSGAGDAVFTGDSAGLKLGACPELLGHRVGFTYDFATGDHVLGSGCDLSAFKALKPPVPDPPKATRAARDQGESAIATPAQRATLARAAQAKGKTRQSFSATGEEGLLSFRVAAEAGAPGSGSPAVKLTGPGLSITSTATKAVKTSRAVAAPGTGRSVSFVVDQPKAGKYTVEAIGKGAPAITKPQFAAVLAPPQVDAELSATQCSPTITWKASGLAGQTLRFVEHAADGAQRILGEETAPSGKRVVSPMAGGGRSQVTVEVVNGSTVRDTFIVGTYNAGVPDHLGGPGNVAFKKAAAIKVKQGKKTVSKKATTISWLGVCGAEAYAVQVGKKPATVVTGTSTVIERPKKGQPVSVTSLGRGRAPGGSTLVPFK